MYISEIRDAMESAIVARGCFIVDIKISKDNDIVLTIESENGTVTLDDCAELSGVFEEKFSRDKEDYSLTVTSAGLDQPFLVLKQYRKAAGTMVEASLKGGRRLIALLTDADENGITVKYTAREKVEGSRKKENVEHTETFSFDEINSVKPYIVF